MQQKFSEIYRYLRAIYRYRIMFITVSLLVMTLIGAYSFTLPKKYKADSTVFIESNVIDELVRGIAITPNIEDKLRVLQSAILSRNIIVKTLEDIDSEIFLKDAATQQEYVSTLIDSTRINTARNMDQFTVSIEDKDPAFAQKFINTLVRKYVEENTSASRDETYGANRFLQEQIEIFKQKLEKAEDVIIDFRKKKGVYFSIDETANLQSIRDFLVQIENIDLETKTLLARKGSIQGQLNTLEPTVDSIVIGSAEGNTLSVLERRLEDLRLRYTDNYPEIIRLKSEINTFRERLTQAQDQLDGSESSEKTTSLNPLYQEVQQRLFEVDAEVSSLQERKRSLEKLVAKRQYELSEVPTQTKELGLLVQERDSHLQIYQELLGRMGQSEVSKQMEIGNKAATFRIVDPAVYPETPVSPNMLQMFLLAIAGGFGCGFGLVFLFENMDSRVRSVDFFEGLGVDILAVVPNISEPVAIKRRWRNDFFLVSLSATYVFCFAGVFAYELFLR